MCASPALLLVLQVNVIRRTAIVYDSHPDYKAGPPLTVGHGQMQGRAVTCHTWTIALQYIGHFRIVLSMFKMSAAEIRAFDHPCHMHTAPVIPN